MTNVTPLTAKQESSKADPMDWLFGEIHGLFGTQFLDKFRSGHIANGKDTGIENMKAVWAEKIRSNRMHLGEIKRGIAGCSKLKFPPSWPDFFELCRPAINVDAAIIEAVQQLQLRNEGKDQWSHPAIYWAAMKVGYHEMTTMTHAQIKPRFAPILDDILAKGDIPEVPPARVALPAPAEKPVAPETLAKFKAALATFKGASGIADHRAWAKRLVAKAEKNPEAVSPLQLRMAKEALAAPEVV